MISLLNVLGVNTITNCTVLIIGCYLGRSRLRLPLAMSAPSVFLWQGTNVLYVLLVTSLPIWGLLVSWMWEGCAVLNTSFWFQFVIFYLLPCWTLMLPLWVGWPLDGALLLVSALFRWLRPPKISIHKRTRSNDLRYEEETKKKLDPAITIFRSSIMLLTCLVILAVDFQQFPRYHRKSIHYGTRLMDLGIGLMVASSGLVSWRSLSDPQWLNSLRSTAGLLVMGVGRAVMVWAFHYHVSVSEYGVHWNFFLTLALLPLASCLLAKVFGVQQFTILGIFLMFCYQLALTKTQLGHFILLDIERESVNFISQNKEGIFGMIGKLNVVLTLLSLSFRLSWLVPH